MLNKIFYYERVLNSYNKSSSLEGSMEKRVFERVSADLPVDYYWDGDQYEGVVQNLSRNGMYITSDTCPDNGSNIEVVLIAGGEAFKISCKVKRTEKINSPTGGMGVELMSPYANYRKFSSIVKEHMHRPVEH